MAQIKIAIDTREQAPWHFPQELATVQRRTLPTGDYCLINEDGTLDTGFAIERKELSDFVGSIITERFERELERMKAFALRLIIVEADDSRIVAGKYNHPDISPAYVTARIVRLQWSGVHFCFAANAHRAAQYAWRHLYERHLMLTDPFYGITTSKS